MLCQAQRLNPFAGDAFLTGYDSKNGPAFSLITAHVAYTKRAESHADYEGMESGVVIKNENGEIIDREGDFAMPEENVVGGWARVFRKGRKPTYKRLHMAQRMPSYETAFWTGAKANEQIVKCAEADALRSTFPTLLGGLPVQGENAINVESVVTTDTPATAAPVKTIAEAAKEPTPQAQLSELITFEKSSLETLLKWGDETGNIPDATSIGTFDEIPSDICRRLLKNKKGLIDGLKSGKGEV